MTFLRIIFLLLAIQSFSQNEVYKKESKNKKMTSKLNLENWENIPCIKNRVATKEDVENGIAVFVIENIEHKPHEINLPKLAFWNDSENKTQKLVAIIQVEETSQGTVVGYKDFDENFGAGFLYEFKILDNKEVEKIRSKR